jgi:hypothetical protein
LDTNIPDRNGTPTVDYSASPRVFDSDRRQGGVLFPSDTASGVADRTNNRVSLGDIRDSTGERCGVLGSGGDQSIFADVHEQPIAPAKSSGDGRVLGEQLPGTAAMFPNGGDPFPVILHSTMEENLSYLADMNLMDWSMWMNLDANPHNFRD